MSGLDEKGLEWPERLTLRDTKVIADEGQRIFTTATGYGYEKREYVRADLVATTPADVGEAPVAAYIQRAALVALMKDKTAKATVASGLLKAPFGDPVPLYSATALERVTRERDEGRKEAEVWHSSFMSNAANAANAIGKSIDLEERLADAEAKLAEARKVIEQTEQQRAEQWRMCREAEADRDTEKAIAATLRARLETVEPVVRFKMSARCDWRDEIGHYTTVSETQSETGEWVRYADHASVLARVTKEQDKWIRQAGKHFAKECELADRALTAEAKLADARGPFKIGDRVTKVKGSSWTGIVCGTYSTKLTPVGYAVESENEPGSVQIYPAEALRNLGTTP